MEMLSSKSDLKGCAGSKGDIILVTRMSFEMKSQY